jgi:RNA polymerase sigma-70 factor (ECF subfamily)
MNENLTQDAGREAADLAMARYARGDFAAFAEVYRYLAPRLQAFLARRCRDRALAEDRLQQTFLRMHRSRESFEPGARVSPWAFTIAARVLVDGRRADRREPAGQASVPLDEEPVAGSRADDVLHARQLMHVVDHELGRMCAGQRSAFQLVRREGLSHADAASTLGVSVTAIKLRVHRARQALEHAIAGLAA